MNRQLNQSITTRFLKEKNVNFVSSRIDCNGTENVFTLRLTCTEGPTAPANCFPVKISLTFRTFAGTWAIFIGLTGILGNMLTLLAIPYAAKRQRFVLLFILFYEVLFLEFIILSKIKTWFLWTFLLQPNNKLYNISTLCLLAISQWRIFFRLSILFPFKSS